MSKSEAKTGRKERGQNHIDAEMDLSPGQNQEKHRENPKTAE